MGAEQSSKLCVQYLAPIIKNRQYNYPPLGINPFVGSPARPNEITYSEDWLQPDIRRRHAAGARRRSQPPPARRKPPERRRTAGADRRARPTPTAGLQGLMLARRGAP